MSQLPQDPEDQRTVGDYRLCAWATSEGSCRIQTSDPVLAKALKRLPDCELIGYSVAGTWIRIFAMPYTLGWVAKNVVEKLSLVFPRKTGVPKAEFAPGKALAPGRVIEPSLV